MAKKIKEVKMSDKDLDWLLGFEKTSEHMQAEIDFISKQEKQVIKTGGDIFQIDYDTHMKMRKGLQEHIDAYKSNPNIVVKKDGKEIVVDDKLFKKLIMPSADGKNDDKKDAEKIWNYMLKSNTKHDLDAERKEILDELSNSDDNF